MINTFKFYSVLLNLLYFTISHQHSFVNNFFIERAKNILNDQFSLIPHYVAEKLAVKEIVSCNQITSRFGLVLSEKAAVALANTRKEVLEKVGRIEFAGGVINKIIMEFCDSPYLSQFNYEESLHELIETFYYFKNETLDEIDDDELIAFMKKSFDKTCQGSIDLLQTRDLENLARKVRFGITDFVNSNEDLEGIFEEDLKEINDNEEEYYEWSHIFSGENYYDGLF